MLNNAQILIQKASSEEEILAVVKRILSEGGGFVGIATSKERGSCSCSNPRCANGQPKKVEVFLSNLTQTQIAQSVLTLIGHCGNEAGNLIIENFSEVLIEAGYVSPPDEEDDSGAEEKSDAVH